MSEDELLSRSLRRRFASDIAEAETFKTLGVSKGEIDDYLLTPEGLI